MLSAGGAYSDVASTATATPLASFLGSRRQYPAQDPPRRPSSSAAFALRKFGHHGRVRGARSRRLACGSVEQGSLGLGDEKRERSGRV